MKKAISFLLALTLACTVAPVGHGEERLPKLQTAIIQADGVPAIRRFLQKGEQVEVTKELDEKTSLADTDYGTGMLETQLLRFPWESEYETWVGYTHSGTGLYKDYELSGKPVKTLAINTKVLVLDELEDGYLISLDLELPKEEPSRQETEPEKREIRIGYAEKKKISKTRIDDSWDGGYSAAPGPSHQDGGDISMAYYGLSLLSNAPTEPEKIGQAQVRVDNAKLIILYFMKGDTVQLVVEEDFAPEVEGYLTIYLDGDYAYIPEGWILMEGEEPFESWNGYAGSNCALYNNYLLRGNKGKSLPLNTRMTVLWDNGQVSVVQLEDKDKTIGFVDSSTLRTRPVSTGGNGGGTDSGSSGNSGSTGEWTPPAL